MVIQFSEEIAFKSNGRLMGISTILTMILLINAFMCARHER